MYTRDFPNPKLNLPKVFRDSVDEELVKSLNAISSYLESIGGFIYTNIDLNYEVTDPKHIHAWLQKLISANLLRSLYIRNSFVELFNARNTVGIYFPLKAWLEIVGVLAVILRLLEKDPPREELFKALEPYMLGNRGKGSLRIGTKESVNVQTMIGKADEYLQKLMKDSSNGKDESVEGAFFTDYYDQASNPTHPSFDAHEMVGGIREGGIWKAKTPDEIKTDLVENRPHYGGLLMAPMFIEDLCEKILEIEDKHFQLLKSQKYFEDLT